MPATRNYRWSTLRKDLVAGLTVAVVALPQSMAYAMLVGLDPVYGIYTAIVTAVIGSLMGSSNHLHTGPTNATSLLVASGMQRFAGQDNFMAMIFLLTLMVGIIKLACGLLRLGRLINYVSHAVIVGFTCGAGVIIALGQLNFALGVPASAAYEPVALRMLHLLRNLDAASALTTAVAIGAFLLLIALRRIDKRIPASLLALAASVVAVRALGLEDLGVACVGAIPRALPAPRLFPIDYESVRALLGAAVPVAVIGMVEAISIAKSIGARTGQRIDADREFVGQGLANGISAFFQCYPASGSFTRSYLNYLTGGVTRMAGVFSGIFVMVLLMGLAPYGADLPKAALAAVIILIGIGMVNVGEIRKVQASGRADAATMWITFLATILMPDLDVAIYFGVFISIVLYLRASSRVPVRFLAPADEGGGFHEVEDETALAASPVLIVHIEGNLYFVMADDLERKLAALRGHAKVFILRLKRVNALDLTTLEVLDAFIRQSREDGAHVLLCGVREEMHKLLEETRIAEKIGRENIFMAGNEILDSTRQAYARAQTLVSPP